MSLGIGWSTCRGTDVLHLLFNLLGGKETNHRHLFIDIFASSLIFIVNLILALTSQLLLTRSLLLYLLIINLLVLLLQSEQLSLWQGIEEEINVDSFLVKVNFFQAQLVSLVSLIAPYKTGK